jgi:hypothetical protein
MVGSFPAKLFGVVGSHGQSENLLGNHFLKTYSYYKRQYLPSHTQNIFLIASIILSNSDDIDRIEL